MEILTAWAISTWLVPRPGDESLKGWLGPPSWRRVCCTCHKLQMISLRCGKCTDGGRRRASGSSSSHQNGAWNSVTTYLAFVHFTSAPRTHCVHLLSTPDFLIFLHSIHLSLTVCFASVPFPHYSSTTRMACLTLFTRPLFWHARHFEWPCIRCLCVLLGVYFLFRTSAHRLSSSCCIFVLCSPLPRVTIWGKRQWPGYERCGVVRAEGNRWRVRSIPPGTKYSVYVWVHNIISH